MIKKRKATNSTSEIVLVYNNDYPGMNVHIYTLDIFILRFKLNCMTTNEMYGICKYYKCPPFVICAIQCADQHVHIKKVLLVIWLIGSDRHSYNDETMGKQEM